MKKKRKFIFLIIFLILVLAVGFAVKKYFLKEGGSGIKSLAGKIMNAKQPQKNKSKEVDLAAKLLSGQLNVPQEKVPVRVYKVSKVDYHDDLPVVGTIKSIPEVSLKFQRNGIIKQFKYKEGNIVKKGDIIAVLDQEEALLEVEWAKAKIASAKAEADTIRKRLEVTKELYNSGALIKSRLEEIEYQLEAAIKKVEQAEVELKSAEAKFDKTNLYAPIDGILGEKEAEEGEFVTPNDKVTSLIDPENLYAEVGIIEKDIGKIKVGQRAKVIVDTYMKQDIEFWGIVAQIFPNIETKSRTLTVRIKVTGDKAKNLLMPGMFARVRIFIYSKQDAIVVPDTAVDLRSRPSEVSFVSENKVSNRAVSVDWVGIGYVVIKAGVNEGDIVVAETPGLKKLKQGTPVEIIETQTSIFE